MSGRPARTHGDAAPRRRLLAFAASAAVAIVAVSWLAWDREALTAWKQNAGVLPFFGGMVLLPAIGIPITPFFILAGATFGSRVGLIGTGIALALNLTLCYAIARWMRPRLASLLRRFRYDLPHIGEQRRSALRFALAVKLAPVPAFVKNYGIVVAGVSFAVYFGVSMAITGSYAAMLILLGQSLFDHRGDRTVLLAALVIGLGLALWRRRRVEASQAPAAE